MKKWSSLSQNDHRLYASQFLLIRFWTRQKLQLTYKRYPVVSHRHCHTLLHQVIQNLVESVLRKRVIATFFYLLQSGTELYSFNLCCTNEESDDGCKATWYCYVLLSSKQNIFFRLEDGSCYNAPGDMDNWYCTAPDRDSNNWHFSRCCKCLTIGNIAFGALLFQWSILVVESYIEISPEASISPHIFWYLSVPWSIPWLGVERRLTALGNNRTPWSKPS